MSLIEDYGLEQPARAYLILALAVEDRRRQKAMDTLHVQKVIRYFEFLGQKKDVDFSNFNLGGVSYELQESLNTLMECGFITNSDRTHFELTDEGKKAAEELQSIFGAEDLRKLTFSKQQLNDLTSDEVMFFMYKVIPETQVNSTEVERLFKRSRELTESLFKKGRISTAMAADWLGLTEQDLLTSVK
jgi:hypothetical protein